MDRDQWTPFAPMNRESRSAAGTLPKNMDSMPTSMGNRGRPQPRTVPLRMPNMPIVR